MAHSLESRVPFLDNDLVDFAQIVPVNFKIGNLNEVVNLDENEPGAKKKKYFQKTHDGKLILRDTLAKYIPNEFTNGIKQGFSAPERTWYRTKLVNYIRETLLQKDSRILEYVNSEYIEKIIDEHINHNINHRLLIWSLLSFEWWLRIFLN